MKILVCISKTPDTTAKIAFTDGAKKFDESGVQWIINPYDEWYALVRAIELKEKDPATIIHLITVGGADAEPIIRKAFFEFMADPGFKIPHYRFGLECYINNIQDQHNIQDFIFAKSLLLLDYIYKSDSENALIIAEELFDKKTYSEDELNSIHIYPCIRFLSYRIFYLELQGEPTTNYFEYLFKYIKNRYAAWDHLEKRIVFHTLCETFFLCQTNTEIQEKELKELFKDLN